MANLDLGNTILLSVSRKLLSFHKWFFTRFEDMPEEVQTEFRHHSHTHPSTFVDTAVYSHTHLGYLEWVLGHDHTFTSGSAGSHQHLNVEVIFLAANLGSPNWWEHKHVMDISCPAAGSSHYHGISGFSTYSICSGYAVTHRHSAGPFGTGYGGASHSHSSPGLSTADADPAGTAENHTHTFSFWTNSADLHWHDTSGNNTSYAYCSGTSQSHRHAFLDDSSVDLHSHQLSGTSGSGGESPVVAKLIGNGLTWVG